MAVDVDGRWSTICCKRTVAVFMVGAVVEERVGGGGDGCPNRTLKDFIAFLSDTEKSYDIRVAQSDNLEEMVNLRRAGISLHSRTSSRRTNPGQSTSTAGPSLTPPPFPMLS